MRPSDEGFNVITVLLFWSQQGNTRKKIAMCAADMKPGHILVDVVWFLDCRGLCVWCLGVVHCHRALQSWSSRFLS